VQWDSGVSDLYLEGEMHAQMQVFVKIRLN
jgi:hypothetical protein